MPCLGPVRSAIERSILTISEGMAWLRKIRPDRTSPMARLFDRRETFIPLEHRPGAQCRGRFRSHPRRLPRRPAGSSGPARHLELPGRVVVLRDAQIRPEWCDGHVCRPLTAPLTPLFEPRHLNIKPGGLPVPHRRHQPLIAFLRRPAQAAIPARVRSVLWKYYRSW